MANSIDFKLFAPNNEEVALLGSFSDWEKIPMQKSEDGYFRTQVELDDGVYQYKFSVRSKSPTFEMNQWVDIVDPFATDIDPAGNGVIRIKTGEQIIDAYVWQHDDKPLPANEELVIYEMHVADFADGANAKTRGRFKNVIDKLDYLSELGINAIELMPVNEYPGDYSWGYKVRHYFAVESSYGTTEDLKRLIDECHSRGIRVILDGIYNHTDEKCPLLLIDRDYWYYHDKHYPEDPANYWGPEFNYENYDQKLDIRPAWEFIGRVVKFWIQEYHIDGIRYDAVRQLGNYDFLYWISQLATQTAGAKPFYNIAEHIPETHSIVKPEGPLDGCWHESFRIFIIQNITGDTFDLGRLKEVLDPKRQEFSTTTNVINYLASHDRDHLMAELATRQIISPESFKRAKLGAVLLMTAVGVPMLWMGEEFGEYTRQTPNQQNQLEWQLLNHGLNSNLFTYYQHLIALRQHNPALKTDNIDFFHENSAAKVFAYVRWHEQGARVVVVVNFSDKDLAGYSIPNFPVAGDWLSFPEQDEVKAVGDNLMIDLPSYEAKVLVWQ